jgi:hypothetical protein
MWASFNRRAHASATGTHNDDVVLVVVNLW